MAGMDVIRNDINEYMARMGRPVLLGNGLIVPERAANNAEVMKAVRQNMTELQQRQTVRKQQMQALQPWGTSMFSSLESYSSTMYGREKRTAPNMWQLETVSYKCPLVTACIVTQRAKIMSVSEVSHDDRTKGWRVIPKRFHDNEYEQNKTDDVIAEDLEVCIKFPDPQGVRDATFAQFLTKLVRMHVVFDRVVVDFRLGQDGKKIAGFSCSDGTTIKPLTEPVIAKTINTTWFHSYTANRMERMLQVIRDMERDCGVQLIARDKQGAELADPYTGEPYLMRWVQVINGKIVNAFDDRRMLVAISNPDPMIDRYGYGISLVEEAVEGIVAWLTAFNYNKNTQVEGNVDGFLGLIGDWDEEVLEQFREEIKARLKGGANAGGIPIIGLNDLGAGSNSDIRWITMRPVNKDSLFDYWLSFVTNLIVSGIFQMHPSEIGMKELGTGGGSLSEPSHESVLNMKAAGHLTILKFIKNQVMDPIVKRLSMSRHNRDDFEFEWVGLNTDMSRNEEVQHRGSRMDKWISINEARMEEGLSLLTKQKKFPTSDTEWTDWVEKMASIPGILIPHAAQFLQQQIMRKMQQQAQQQQQIQGQAGGGDYWGNEDEQEPADEKKVEKSYSADNITIRLKR